MREETPPTTSHDAESVRTFYDHFADTRMAGYLQEPNLRIEKAIARILPLVTARSTILEIGCGIGLVAERIVSVATAGFIWACDISEKNITYARQRVRAGNARFRCADVLARFDEIRSWISTPVQIVVMVDVLEHLPIHHHLQLFRNLRTVMDQDATLVLTYPSPEYQRYLRSKKPDELQIIDEVIELPHLIEIASQTGFSITHFSLEDVSVTHQYVHCLLTTSAALAPVEVLPWLRLALQELAYLIPPGDSFIFVDDSHWKTEDIDGRLVVPFLERDGCCWGPPPDDATAVQELDRLRRVGASFIVFAHTTFWWLDYYTEFYRHLRSNFPCILQNERLIIFDLRAKGGSKEAIEK